MGKQVVDHSSKLQAYAEVQPEMPPIEFLVPDHPNKDVAASVYVPPAALLEKLLANTKVSDTIRWDKPYDKLKSMGKLFLWLLVSSRSA